MNKFLILISVVVLSFILVKVFTSSDKNSIDIFHKNEIHFNNAISFIKMNKIKGEYYIDGRILNRISGISVSPLDSVVGKIGVETNLRISSSNDSQFYISFQLFPEGLDEGEYYIQYFDDGLNRDDVYKNDFESSRMRVKILDKNWILFVEFPNIGGYGK